MERRRKALALFMQRLLALEETLSPSDMDELQMSTGWKKEIIGSDSEPFDDKLFNDAYHCLQHFFSDRGIRMKDFSYAQLQIASMKRYIQELEA